MTAMGIRTIWPTMKRPTNHRMPTTTSRPLQSTRPPPISGGSGLGWGSGATVVSAMSGQYRRSSAAVRTRARTSEERSNRHRAARVSALIDASVMRYGPGDTELTSSTGTAYLQHRICTVSGARLGLLLYIPHHVADRRGYGSLPPP